MKFELRKHEEIKLKAHFHWSDYVFAALWGFIVTPALVISIYSGADPISPGLCVLIGYGPLVYKITKNNCRRYFITNQRLYVEEGILIKSATNIPLKCIHDITFTQNSIQKMMDVAGVRVFTGKHRFTTLGGISAPASFRRCIHDHQEIKAS